MPNENQSTGTDLFEIIRTTRSAFPPASPGELFCFMPPRPDPLSENLLFAPESELIRKILEAGVCAPSGGNMQRWRFLVIRDPKIKGTCRGLV
jgi:nitroreductase